VLAYVYICVRGLLTEGLNDRAVNQAWTRLAPVLHADGFSTDDSAFLAELALASVGRATPPSANECSINS